MRPPWIAGWDHRSLIRHQYAWHGRPRALREVKESRPDLPVIMVTAYGDEGRRRRAKEYGAAFFITKPVDFESLKAQLRQLTAPTST